MALRFLDFDYSEDDAGHGVFDAMASVWPEQLAALHAEVATVLAWAHEHFGQDLGPIEEGGEWHYDLSAAQEFSIPQDLVFDPETRQIRATPGTAGRPRHGVSLSLSGTAVFCTAFREQFAIDE